MVRPFNVAPGAAADKPPTPFPVNPWKVTSFNMKMGFLWQKKDITNKINRCNIEKSDVCVCVCVLYLSQSSSYKDHYKLQGGRVTTHFDR